MLTIKEISEKFNISKSTLYGWEKERAEIFTYLQRAGDKYEELRDVTILHERYSKEIVPLFALQEIEFLLSLQLRLLSIDDIENLPTLYSHAIIKDIKAKSSFVMPLYAKLEKLSLVEKYIFASRYKELQQKLPKTKEDKSAIIQHYFKPFIIA